VTKGKNRPIIGVEALLKLVALKQRRHEQRKETQVWVKQGSPPASKEAKEAEVVAATAGAESAATAAGAEPNAQQRAKTTKAKS